MNKEDGKITKLLQDWSGGSEEALNALMPFIYKELRKRAGAFLRNERQGHTLQTTALINEAYINLVGKEIEWESRSHFLAIASKAMRRILVDHARKKNRQKRGGSARSVSIDESGTVLMKPERGTDLIELDDALKRLSEFDNRLAEVVELKFFGGFTDDDTSRILGVSNVTVRRHWKLAKAWLYSELNN